MTKYRPRKLHDPIDETVQVPAAIRAAAARSEELHKQLYEEPANSDVPPAGQEPPVTPPEPPVTPEPTPAPVEPLAGQEPPPATGQEPINWEHNYNSIKGRYDKQAQTISGLNSRISQLEAMLASRTAAQPAPQVRTPDLQFTPVTKEERENYGDEFLDVAARAAAEKVVPEITSLRQELDALKGRVSNVAETTVEERKDKTREFLTAQFPNWRVVNKDQKFLAWLNLPDPLSGAIRMAMMRDAFDKGDGPRVLRFFQGFLSDEAANGPAIPSRPEMPQGKVPLETFAAPGRAKAPAATETPQSPGEKETISHAQIAHFYQLVQKGHYRGNEAEKDRLEKMIFEAQAEGLVV